MVPAVSVLLSVFNGEAFIGGAIESLLAQTFRDFELIVVDDGSTDRTGEILAQYAARDSRIVILRSHPNAGVVRALNRGLQSVRGEFIARQDADDLSHPQRIARQAAFLDAHLEYGLVAAVPEIIDINGQPMPDAQFSYDATEDEDIQRRLLDYMCLCGPSVMIRRTCFQAAGYSFAEGLDASEDYDLCLRIAEQGRMASLIGGLYLYRQHPASASRVREQQQMVNKAIALERAIERRMGPGAAREHYATVARDYLHAAVIGFARGDQAGARQSMARVLAWRPAIFDEDEPAETLIKAYTPLQPVEAALAYTESIFGKLLPVTPRLARLRARLLSELHMSQVFAGIDPQQPEVVKAHLKEGIRLRPAWLLNRGVRSILVKSALVKKQKG